jgi:hypothetical protein
MDPTVIDKTLAKRKGEDQKLLNSKKTNKNNFIITLKIIIFGKAAKRRVTLVVAPSYTSHNQE